MMFFYGLWGAGVKDPFRTHLEQNIAALRTALFATLACSPVLWFGAKQARSFPTAILKTGIATQVLLTLYALAGWQSPGILNLIFPSTFFAEYNWLTFIFEVAPVTAITAGLIQLTQFK